MKFIRPILLSAALLSSVASFYASAETAPEVLAKETTQKLLTALQEQKEQLKTEPAKVYQLVDDIVLPHFDFARMAKLVLAQHWQDATEPQRQKFTDQFRALLVRTYASSLVYYSGQEVNFPEVRRQPEDRRVTIVAEVKNKDNKTIPLSSEMYQTPNGWKVYDVKIDGVSLVTNYRASFDTEIKQKGLEGLITAMEQKQIAETPVGGAAQP